MEKHKIRINNIIIDDNLFNIISSNGNKYISNIKKGSVNFKIYNEDNTEINIGNLEEGMLAKIYGKPDNKKNIIINKIVVKNIYAFNSETSEEFDDI